MLLTIRDVTQEVLTECHKALCIDLSYGVHMYVPKCCSQLGMLLRKFLRNVTRHSVLIFLMVYICMYTMLLTIRDVTQEVLT